MRYAKYLVFLCLAFSLMEEKHVQPVASWKRAAGVNANKLSWDPKKHDLPTMSIYFYKSGLEGPCALHHWADILHMFDMLELLYTGKTNILCKQLTTSEGHYWKTLKRSKKTTACQCYLSNNLMAYFNPNNVVKACSMCMENDSEWNAFYNFLYINNTTRNPCLFTTMPTGSTSSHGHKSIDTQTFTPGSGQGTQTAKGRTSGQAEFLLYSQESHPEFKALLKRNRTQRVAWETKWGFY